MWPKTKGTILLPFFFSKHSTPILGGYQRCHTILLFFWNQSSSILDDHFLILPSFSSNFSLVALNLEHWGKQSNQKEISSSSHCCIYQPAHLCIYILCLFSHYYGYIFPHPIEGRTLHLALSPDSLAPSSKCFSILGSSYKYTNML